MSNLPFFWGPFWYQHIYIFILKLLFIKKCTNTKVSLLIQFLIENLFLYLHLPSMVSVSRIKQDTTAVPPSPMNSPPKYSFPIFVAPLSTLFISRHWFSIHLACSLRKNSLSWYLMMSSEIFSASGEPLCTAIPEPPSLIDSPANLKRHLGSFAMLWYAI